MSLSRMKNPKWLCPYCDTEYRSTLFVKHLFNNHFKELFDPETAYGKKNIFTFTVERKEARPLFLNHPNDKCPDIALCLGCMTGCAKQGSALKHFEKPLSHSRLHLDKFNELREKVLAIKEGKTTPSEANTTVVEQTPTPQLDDYTGVQKLIWRLMKESFIRERVSRLNEKLEEYLEEKFEDGTLDREEFEDREEVDEPYIAEPSWALYGDLPFPKDPETLIRKFEKAKDQDLWLGRIDPSAKRKQTVVKEKKVVPPPAPEPKEPAPEPVPEPAPEPKPTPQPLASPLDQSYKPPPVTPSLPTIIKITKR